MEHPNALQGHSFKMESVTMLSKDKLEMLMIWSIERRVIKGKDINMWGKG